MKLYLIDAIGPFFIGYQNRVINWSKIPFSNLEKEGRLDESKIEPILQALSIFIEKAASLGFNSLTLDDIAHLVDFEFYPERLKQKIYEYQALYSKIFAIAAEHQIKVFMNTDVMFYNKYIHQYLQESEEEIGGLLSRGIKKVLEGFDIEGVVLRIGETDGEDVIGDFNSRIVIKTTRQTNQLIRCLLPVFEKNQKLLIFRNWTIGSYPIGDLIWNRKTYEKAFQDINSDSFVVSMKYGDTDFFSRLELNPLFFDNSQQMILEVQTRRERECFGVLPYYVGWEYERYYQELKELENLAGISVWCQTGGWSSNKNLTFIENSSIWNELNTIAAIRIFMDGLSANEVIRRFFRNELYVEFLRLFNDIFIDLLYIDDFSSKTLYFRRTRVPPLLWISWDYVTINPLMTSIYMSFMGQIRELDETKIERVYRLGKALKIDNIDYCYDTLRLFQLCRKTLLGQCESYRLLEFVNHFRRWYRPSNFKLVVKEGRSFVLPVKLMFKLFTRSKPEYRIIDRILLNRFFAYFIYRLLLLFSKGRMPNFLNKRAMKLETLFK